MLMNSQRAPGFWDPSFDFAKALWLMSRMTWVNASWLIGSITWWILMSRGKVNIDEPPPHKTQINTLVVQVRGMPFISLYHGAFLSRVCLSASCSGCSMDSSVLSCRVSSSMQPVGQTAVRGWVKNGQKTWKWWVKPEKACDITTLNVHIPKCIIYICKYMSPSHMCFCVCVGMYMPTLLHMF